MRQRLAGWCTRGWAVVCAFRRALLLGVMLSAAAAVIGAPADMARGLAWLQAQVMAQGALAAQSVTATSQQARCETANTLLKLAGNSAQVSALVASLQEPTGDAATENMACWQLMRQQLGQTILASDVEARRLGAQGYAPLEGFGVATALDTGWALSAQLQNLGASDKSAVLGWLQSTQAADGSFSAAGASNVLATAVILRAVNSQASTQATAASIASKAAAWLLGRQDGGAWLGDVAATAVVFEAVHPYTGPTPGIASSVNAYLLSQQGADGSWASDPYVTAVALRALALTSLAPVDPTVAATSATLRGTVVAAATGLPVAGATVTATPSGSAAKSATSDANGQYMIQGIAPGPVNVAASMAGFQNVSAAVTLATGSTSFFSPTLYTNGVTPPAGGHVSGSVVAFGSYTPLPAAAVQAVSSGAPPVNAVTDAGGRFDMVVPSGSSVLSFALTGYLNATQQVIVTNGSAVNLGAIPLQPARQTSTLRGVVYDFGGQPIAGAAVQVGSLSTTTNSGGAYSLAGVTGTSFVVQASAAGYSAQSQPVTIAQPTDVVQDLVLAAAGSGYLTLSNLQQPVASAGLRQDVTATVVVTNTTTQAASEGLAMDVVGPAGQLVTTLAATDSIGIPLSTSLNPGQSTTGYFKWNSGSFPPGDYQLVAKLYLPGTVTQQNPGGVVAGSLRGAISVHATAHFTGAVTANPPVVAAGASQPVALSALIQNDGNTPLPAQGYLLTVVDTATGATTHTQTISVDAVGVSQLQPLAFASWTPPAGGNFSVRVTAPATPGSQISTPLYVGAAGQAAFAVDKAVVPAGTQSVRGTVDVTGQNSANGAIQDPLAPLVQQALVKAVRFGDSYALSHYQTQKCYACHVEAQSLAGGERSLKYSPPVSELARAVLATGIAQHVFNPNDTSVGATGPTSDEAVILYTDAPNVYRLAGTTVGLWGLSQWHDLGAVNYTRGRLARYVMGKQSTDGSWLPDMADNWWSTKAPLTALNASSLLSVKRELGKQPSTFAGKSLVNVTAPGLPSSTWRLAADASGNLYAAGSPGVWKVPLDGSAATRLSTISANVVLPLADGRMLIGATGGLYLRQVNGTVTTLGGWPVSDVMPLPDGTFLMTTPWWDPAANLYKVTIAGALSNFAPSTLIPGKSGTAALPDGSVVAVNGTNRTMIRFAPDGTLRDMPVPAMAMLTATNQAQAMTVRPYKGGVVMGTERGLFFYDQNWVGQRWSHDWAYGPASTPDGRLFVNAGGGVYEVKDKPVDQAALAAQIDTSMNKAATWLRDGTGVDQNSNVDLAFQLMGLADAKTYFQGTSRAGEFDAKMQSVAATLQARQDARGGWVWRQSSETATNPMVTAMAGVALDTLNPSPNSPAVRNAVQFLLSAQQEDGTWTKSQKPDGTWTPIGYATPLIPTTWVEIWLPMTMDRLAHMDSTLSVTFPANVSMSNPTATPASAVTAADGSTNYQWKFTTASDAPAQVAFDLTLANMQVDEVRAVAQQASLLFKNGFTGETVTSAVAVPSVAVTTSLTETVATDKPVYTEADQATFMATVRNAGTQARNAQVRFTVLDASGNAVQTLPLPAPVSVAGGATAAGTGVWSTAGFLAGTYQVRADLVSPAGLTYASSTATFSVTASQQQASGTRILTDRVSYSAAQVVQLTATAANQTSNTLLSNMQAITTVTGAAGQSVFTQPEPIDQLAPGGQRQYGYSLAAAALPVGTYQASVKLVDAQGNVLSQSTASFSVLGADQTGVGIVGEMQANPSVPLIGQPVAVNLTATNASTTALSNVPVTVRMIDPATGAVIDSYAQTISSWAAGASQSVLWNWTSTGADGQTVVAAATASIAGRDVPLAQATIRLTGVPKLGVQPTQLDFPVIYMGETGAAQTVTVSSVGTATATSIATALAGVDAAQFAVSSNGCAQASLAIGASCTFTVNYQPTQAAQHGAQVTVSSVGAGDIAVALAGQAKPIVVGGSLTMPAQVVLGQGIDIGWSASNPAAAATTAQLTLSVIDAGGQTVASWPIQAALEANAARSGSQTYATAGVPQTLNVVLTQSVQGSPTVVASGAFTVVGVPQLSSPTAQASFGPVYAGEVAVQTVTINSVGSVPATSLSFTLGGADASQFLIRSGGCTQQSALPIGASCQLTLSYQPAQPGAHDAQLHVGYAVGNDLVIALAGQAKAVAFSGSVAADASQVEAGSAVGLSYTVTNPASVAANFSGSLTVAPAAGQPLATWPISATVAAGATYAGNQPFTTPVQPQALNLALSQQIGTGTFVLARNSFTTVDAQVPLGVTTGMHGQARVLVLVTCPPGLGASDDAACVQARSQAISLYLNALGIQNKIVTTGDEFLAQMRCGPYNTYWLSGGAVKLSAQTAEELREAVWRGDALWTDGLHDSRNSLLYPAQGVTQTGKLPTSNQAAAFEPASSFGTASLPTLGQPTKFALTSGQGQAFFNQVPGQQAPVPAVVTNAYGSGNSLLFAFDLAAMLTADANAANAQLAGFVAASASYAATTTPTLTIGDITVVETAVTNQGTRTASLQVQATLPAGLASVASTPSAQLTTQTNGSVLANWNLTLAAGATQVIDWQVKAVQAGSYSVPVQVYSLPAAGSTAPPKLRQSASVAVLVKDAAGLLQQAQAQVDALQPTASNDKSNKTKAQAAVVQALNAYSQGNYEAAIAQGIAAADAVIGIGSVDTTAAHSAIAMALEAANDALCVQRCGSAGCQ